MQVSWANSNKTTIRQRLSDFIVYKLRTLACENVFSEKTEHKLALDICNICKQQNINFQIYNSYRTINRQVNKIEKVFGHEQVFLEEK